MHAVQLQGLGRQFRGFMIQVRDTSSGMLIGTFSLDAAPARFLDCFSNPMGTVSSHTYRGSYMRKDAVMQGRIWGGALGAAASPPPPKPQRKN